MKPVFHLAIILTHLVLASNCYAEAKYPLLIRNIGLGYVEPPCIPHEVKYFSNIDGKLEKILLKCSLNKIHDSIDVTFSSDGKNVVRVLREQYLTKNDPDPADILKAAISFYGTPVESDHGISFAIYGNAHYCKGCKTDIETNSSGIGLVICRSSGFDFNRRIFHDNDSGVVYELVDMPELLRAHEDGKIKAKIFMEKSLSDQKF